MTLGKNTAISSSSDQNKVIKQKNVNLENRLLITSVMDKTGQF